MKFFTLFFLIIFFFKLLQASVIVESIGTGQSLEEAKKDAIAKALRKQVGEYVRVKQQVEDENLSEKLLNFSNAYVLDFQQISAEKNAQGLIELKAKIELEEGNLKGVLRELNVDMKNISQGSFKVFVNERQTMISNFKAMYQDVVLKPFESGEAFYVKVLNFEPWETSSVYKEVLKPNRPRDGSRMWLQMLDRVRQVKEKEPDYFAYLITFKMGYEQGYLEGVQKLFDKVATKQTCKIRTKSKEERMNNQILDKNYVAITSYTTKRTFIDLFEYPEVLWCVLIPEEFTYFITRPKARTFLRLELLRDGAESIFMNNIYRSSFDFQKDYMGDIYSLDYLDSQTSYNAAVNTPELKEVPNLNFLNRSDTFGVLIFLTQEEVQGLREIKLEIKTRN